MTWIKELRGHSNRMLAKRHACWTTSPSGPSRSSLVLHWSSLLWIPGSDWKVSRHEPLATGARLIYPRKDQQIGAGHGCQGFFAKTHCASIYFPLSTPPQPNRVSHKISWESTHIAMFLTYSLCLQKAITQNRATNIQYWRIQRDTTKPIWLIWSGIHKKIMHWCHIMDFTNSNI